MRNASTSTKPGRTDSPATARWKARFILATDGQASHPHSPTHTPERLAERLIGRERMKELRIAQVLQSAGDLADRGGDVRGVTLVAEQVPEAVVGAVVELGDAIDTLYWESIDRPKTVHWLQAYELVASVVTPHPASVWAQGLPREVLAGPPKGYTDLVLDDEFPLSMFFEALEKKMRGVIESTAGIRGTDA